SIKRSDLTALNGIQQNIDESLVSVIAVGFINKWKVHFFVHVDLAPQTLPVYCIILTDVLIRQGSTFFNEITFHCIISAERFADSIQPYLRFKNSNRFHSVLGY